MAAKNEVPNAQDFGLMRAYLAQQGFTQAWINATVGTAPNGRTREQITAELRTAMRTLPKG